MAKIITVHKFKWGQERTREILKRMHVKFFPRIVLNRTKDSLLYCMDEELSREFFLRKSQSRNERKKIFRAE